MSRELPPLNALRAFEVTARLGSVSQAAEQLGIAPETFSRVLRRLRERDLISGRGRQLRLLDLNGLRSLAGT